MFGGNFDVEVDVFKPKFTPNFEANLSFTFCRMWPILLSSKHHMRNVWLQSKHHLSIIWELCGHNLNIVRASPDPHEHFPLRSLFSSLRLLLLETLRPRPPAAFDHPKILSLPSAKAKDLPHQPPIFPPPPSGKCGFTGPSFLAKQSIGVSKEKYARNFNRCEILGAVSSQLRDIA